MPRLYRCCDFTLSSELDLAFPEAASDEADVVIRFQSFEHNPSRVGERGGDGLWARAEPNRFELRANGIAHYLVRNGNEILIDPYPGAWEENIRGVLLSSGFAALLVQRGFLVLHGGVVALADEGRAGEGMALLGNSGVGKSTLVSSLQDHGAVVLSDELCAVRAEASGRMLVWPVHPVVSLCEDAYRRHGTQPDQPLAVAASADKFHVPARHPATGPVPLNWVIELRKAKAGLSWQDLRGADKLPTLLRNTYLLPSLADMALTEVHRDQCLALARQAEFRRVTRPFEPVPEADFIAQLQASLAAGAAA
jgi:hypothetical protein